ncbi:hypothetical protein C3R44_23155, partial [Mycobacterium tuberculosis]|uniref:hypothetical protein n=1 Tax=Mycobacterium tuberculosis TaxID=1773 RepID=UPI000E3B021D
TEKDDERGEDARSRKTKSKAREGGQTRAERQGEAGDPESRGEDTGKRAKPREGKSTHSNRGAESRQGATPAG